MDIDVILKKVQLGEELSLEEFDALRAREEILNDAQERAFARALGADEHPAFATSAGGPRVAIVVGHTANAPGAYGTAPISQNEYFWNKSLAALIGEECTRRGLTNGIFYRDNVGIFGAYRQVGDWGATCVMELHFNAFNGTAHGTETLYDNDTNSGSKAWANRLQSAMLNALDLHDRGLIERDPGDRGYSSVSALDIPSALVEPFFGDNANEAQVAQAKRNDLAAALATAAEQQLSMS